MRNFVILLVLALAISGSCSSNSQRQPTEQEKYLNQVNDILDAINKEPFSERFLRCPGGYGASGASVYSNVIAGQTDVKFLIGHSEIAFPLMFKRIEKISNDSPSLILYFIVFQHTKSVESIPYLVDYFTSCPEEPIEHFGTFSSVFTFAVIAAEEITSLKLVKYDESKKLLNPSIQSLDIAKKLRQWYEEHKK